MRPVEAVESRTELEALKARHEELRARFDALAASAGTLQRAAATAEERCRLVLRATHDRVWEWDLEDGSTRRPAKALGAARIIHSDDRLRVERSLREALDGPDDQWSQEYRVRLPDGTSAVLLDRAVIARREGKAYRVVGVLTDVTQARQAEAGLRARFEVSLLLGSTTGGEPVWLDLLRVLCETLAWEAGAYWKAHPNAGVLRRKAVWSRAGAPDGALSSPTTLERGSGLPSQAWAQQGPVWQEGQEDGSPGTLCFPVVDRQGVQGVFQFVCEKPDIDLRALCRLLGRKVGAYLERLESEQAMRRQQTENSVILDSVHAMIWFKDKQNRILRCNRAAAEAACVRAGEAPLRFEDDLEVIRSGRPKRGIIERLCSKDGSQRWVTTDKLPYRDEKGEIVGVIVFSLDITDQKRAQDMLRETERAQKEFVANVSHELRTPVAAIKGFAETLRLGAMDDVKMRTRFLRIIESHADRLDWLIEDILTLSSFDGGRRVELAPVALRDFVGRYVSSMSAMARGQGITVKVDIAPGLRVMADGPHLIQVIENLYANALKFNRPKGRVWISARRQAGFVRLTVRDNGIGIAPDHLRRVFDRFYRVEKGASPGSSGLGLHIVKTIIEAHNGRVWAESVPGRGSSFHVSLPVVVKN